MSFGSSKGSKQSSSQQQQQWNYGTDVWGPQQGYLQDLYAGLQQQSQQPVGGMGTLDQAGNMYAQGQAALGSPYMQGAQNTLQGMQQGYNVDPTGALGRTAQGYNVDPYGTLKRLQNPGVDPMMDVYSRNIGQQFREQIMPELQGQAAMGGGLGGSRAQIGQALAGSRMGQQLQDFGAQLYGQNQDRALQAANTYGGLQGQMQGMRANAAQAAGQLGQGISGLYGQFGQGMQGLAQQQAQQPWMNLQQYGALLGAPAMQNLGGYGTGSSKGKSNSWNLSMSGGLW